MIKSYEAHQIIKSKLSPQRVIHSCNVADVAKKLAGQFGIDEEMAYITGLLHDYAKGLAASKLLEIAVQNDLIEDEIEHLIPDILHGKVGAFLLEKEGIIQERQVLDAIANHTLGSINMSELDKIVFLADMIEPGRDYPSLERLHCLAFKDLDAAMLYGLESTIKHCLEEKRLLHSKTIVVRNTFLKLIYE
ncbi:MAG TPA: bis(5'-nucleosyl)-tetraphosphatase (symmetrical) YqeK [Syntrophomonadaceae bacterium]|nr:bis(5'-nucleosyl)-tetraphosphatase (symmetrical) YqeK [Syntrophomonadaceae bacterium]